MRGFRFAPTGCVCRKAWPTIFLTTKISNTISDLQIVAHLQKLMSSLCAGRLQGDFAFSHYDIQGMVRVVRQLVTIQKYARHGAVPAGGGRCSCHQRPGCAVHLSRHGVHQWLVRAHLWRAAALAQSSSWTHPQQPLTTGCVAWQGMSFGHFAKWWVATGFEPVQLIGCFSNTNLARLKGVGGKIAWAILLKDTVLVIW